ncbi:putative serine/threonine-kinase pknI domain protein [Mycobacterium kansasii]|uniref:Putative serine/threonine-kinase pknI domain protein n=1 Tax=Mycobacterium kansasii TaxID=1768 RepID=A0A1V3XTA0_MYCKA|nr:putative serine/threonine-kinase pknI domain protein [Mycobacterium kansasii]
MEVPVRGGAVRVHRANGAASTQATTQVLSLRPQPVGDLVGEMVVTVHSNDCGQQGAVIRIPAVASRSGDLPPAVNVPDPVTIPENPPATTTPTTLPSGRAAETTAAASAGEPAPQKIVSDHYLCYGSWQLDDPEEL